MLSAANQKLRVVRCLLRHKANVDIPAYFDLTMTYARGTTLRSLLKAHYLQCTAGVLAEVVEAVNPCPPPYTWAAPGIPKLILSFMVCERDVALSDVEEACKRTLSVFSRWRERDTGKRKRKGGQPHSEDVDSRGPAKRHKVGGE